MQRKFLTNLGLLMLLNILIKPFWIFGIDRTVQNVVGAESYGLYFSILNLTILFNILLDFGITNYNNRNIAQNNQLLNKHFSSIIILRLLLAFVYMLVIFCIALILGYDVYQLKILCWLAVNQCLLSIILYLRSNLSALHLFKTDSFLSVLDKALMILVCGLLLWGHVTEISFQIEWFVYTQTATYALTALIAMMIVAKKASFKKLHWNRPFFIMIVKKSFPFALLTLLMAFYNRIDTVMIERILTNGAQQAGIYASAYRLLDASTMIAYLFAVLLLPIFAKMIKIKESVEGLVKLSFTLLFTLSLVVAMGSYFYRVELMTLLYPKHINEPEMFYMTRIQESSIIFGLLMSSFIAISSSYVFGTLLTARGSLKVLNIIAAIGMILNVTLNLILIPRWQAIGSAYANIIAQFATVVIQLIMVQWYFRFKMNYSFLLTLVIFIIGVYVINSLSRQLPFTWVLSFTLMVGLSLLLAALLKLLNYKALMKTIRNK